MSKKVLVVCGNGIASSSIMVASLNDWLKEKNISGVTVDKSSLMDCTVDKFNSYDLIVSSTKLDNPKVTTPVIVGAGLLTGIGEDVQNVHSYQEAIKKAGEALVSSNAVTSKFSQACIDREADFPTGLLLPSGRGVAIPHGDSSLVKKSSISILRLDNMVDFGLFLEKLCHFSKTNHS